MEGNRFWLMLSIGEDGRSNREAELDDALRRLAKLWWSDIPHTFIVVSDQSIDGFWHGIAAALDPIEDIAVLGQIGSTAVRTLGRPPDSDFRRVLGLA